MKILLVIDNLGSGGAQNQLTILAACLKKHGHSVAVFTYFPQDFFLNRLRDLNIPYSCVPKKGKLGLNVIGSLKKLIDRESFDQVWSYLDTPNFYNLFASRFSYSKPKTVINYRSRTDIRKLSIIQQLQKRWVNNKADAIVANSNHERENWCENNPFLNSKFTTIYNLIEPRSIIVKNSFEFKYKVLAVGKLRVLKNAETIIKALEKILELKIELHWFGGVNFENVKMQEYSDSIKELVKNSGLAGKWEWKGKVDNIGQVYHKYDALIHPSLVEGLPNVVCEAMTAGVPVFASNILDHPYLLDHNDAYLFDPLNAGELANKISKHYENNEEGVESYSHKLRARANKLFDPERNTQVYLKVLN